QLDETLRERQAKPGSLVPAGQRAIELPARLQGHRDLLGVHADPRVRYLDDNVVAVAPCRNLHAAARRRELDRVREQIKENLLDPSLIPPEGRQIRRDLCLQRQAAPLDTPLQQGEADL